MTRFITDIARQTLTIDGHDFKDLEVIELGR